MKVKNKHGRVGVKRPLAADEKRRATNDGYSRGWKDSQQFHLSAIAGAKSLRELKKELKLS